MSAPYTPPGEWRVAVRKQAPRRLKPFLLLLGERAQRDGTVRRATRLWLAQQFDVDPRTIQRWVKESCSAGWIVVAQRGQKHVAAQVYGLTVPASQGDIRSCSQGDIPMLPEKHVSGRQPVSPIYRQTERSEGVAVHVDATGENTTAASASDLTLRRTAAAHARPARRKYRCAAACNRSRRLVQERFADDVKLAALRGLGGDEFFGTLPGSADPDDDFPFGVLLRLNHQEDFGHVSGSTRTVDVYLPAGLSPTTEDRSTVEFWERRGVTPQKLAPAPSASVPGLDINNSAAAS